MRCLEERRGNHIGTIFNRVILPHPYCLTSRGTARLNIPLGIANHPRHGQVDIVGASREQQHSGLRLAARARRLGLMRTVIDCVNRSASGFKLVPHLCVHGFQLVARDAPLGDASLIAYDEYKEPGAIQQADSFIRPGEKFHLLPPSNIFALWSFTVNHSVTIKKGSFIHKISLAL
jgi:hypothetical protein